MNQPNKPKQFAIYLSPEMLEVVLAGILELPGKSCLITFNEIQKQASEQIAALNADPADNGSNSDRTGPKPLPSRISEPQGGARK